MEDIWAVSSLGLFLKKREYEYFCAGFRWTSFHVSEITAEIFNCWLAWKLYVELKKYCKPLRERPKWFPFPPPMPEWVTASPGLTPSLFFMLAFLTGLQWLLLVALIFIYLMANNVKHHLICLFAICISSAVKCLFMSFVHFLIGLFTFLLLSCESSL